MIRIVIVDDHPTLRAGLQLVLEREPGLLPVGTGAHVDDLLRLLRRTRADVALLDYRLPGLDGLQTCRIVKHQLPETRILIYSASVDECLRVAARLAGADGVLDKSCATDELFDAIRLVAGRRSAFGPIAPESISAALGVLDAEDAPIVAMLIDDTPAEEIADALGIHATTVRRRIGRMIERLVATTSVRE